MAQTPVSFRSADGLLLEGRLARPNSSPAGVAVLCHPYPPAGGTMSSIVIPRLARAFEAAGWAALRFNFRGVGRSEGVFAGGVEEPLDVAGALGFVRAEYPGAPAAVAGWSFGAIVGIRAAIDDGAVEAYAGIAPPLDADGYALPSLPSPAGRSSRRLLVCGDRDPFCSVGSLREAAGRLGAQMHVVPGADHAFSGCLDALTKAVIGFVAGNA